MADDITIRPIAIADAVAMTEYLIENHDYFAPYDPPLPDDYLTVTAQRERIAKRLAEGAPEVYPFVIERGGELVGQMTLSNISRGPWQNCTVGYSVAERATGQGVATRALKLAVARAFGPLELHRVEAGTLVDNLASQRVLEKCGFTRIGVSPRHLFINGEWRDMVLFSLVAEDVQR